MVDEGHKATVKDVEELTDALGNFRDNLVTVRGHNSTLSVSHLHIQKQLMSWTSRRIPSHLIASHPTPPHPIASYQAAVEEEVKDNDPEKIMARVKQFLTGPLRRDMTELFVWRDEMDESGCKHKRPSAREWYSLITNITLLIHRIPVSGKRAPETCQVLQGRIDELAAFAEEAERAGELRAAEVRGLATEAKETADLGRSEAGTKGYLPHTNAQTHKRTHAHTHTRTHTRTVCVCTTPYVSTSTLVFRSL